MKKIIALSSAFFLACMFTVVAFALPPPVEVSVALESRTDSAEKSTNSVVNTPAATNTTVQYSAGVSSIAIAPVTHSPPRIDSPSILAANLDTFTKDSATSLMSAPTNFRNRGQPTSFETFGANAGSPLDGL